MVDGRDDKMSMYLDNYYAINFIGKVQHNKTSKEKVFSHLEKTQVMTIVMINSI